MEEGAPPEEGLQNESQTWGGKEEVICIADESEK